MRLYESYGIEGMTDWESRPYERSCFGQGYEGIRVRTIVPLRGWWAA